MSLFRQVMLDVASVAAAIDARVRAVGRAVVGLSALVLGTPLAFLVLYFAASTVSVLATVGPEWLAAASLGLSLVLLVVAFSVLAVGSAAARALRPVLHVVVSKHGRVRSGGFWRPNRIVAQLEVTVAVYEGGKLLFERAVQRLDLNLHRHRDAAMAREIVEGVTRHAFAERERLARQFPRHLILADVGAHELRSELQHELGQLRHP